MEENKKEYNCNNCRCNNCYRYKYKIKGNLNETKMYNLFLYIKQGFKIKDIFICLPIEKILEMVKFSMFYFEELEQYEICAIFKKSLDNLKEIGDLN